MARGETISERPAGLDYRANFISEDEERGVLALLDEIDFREVRLRGQVARRTVRHFGFDYGYESWQLAPTDPLPSPLRWLRDRGAELAGVESEELAQVLVTRYPPGATIGWHRDAPMFGPKVVGVSLLSACRMRFQRKAGAIRRIFELELAPRSGYLLGGSARSAWQHSIPPTKSLRYSITLRTVKNPTRWLG